MSVGRIPSEDRQLRSKTSLSLVCCCLASSPRLWCCMVLVAYLQCVFSLCLGIVNLTKRELGSG